MTSSPVASTANCTKHAKNICLRYAGCAKNSDIVAGILHLKFDLLAHPVEFLVYGDSFWIMGVLVHFAEDFPYFVIAVLADQPT
jgi:hypothetical protein